MTAETPLLRPHAEQLFAEELAALDRVDDRPRPPQWRLSPWAVTTYLLGGEADGVTITPKYVGKRRLVELAVATLATDRALLLLGVPGTAKTWMSEHLERGGVRRQHAGRAGNGRHARGGAALRLELRAAARRGPVPRRARPRPGLPRDAGRQDRPRRGAHAHPVRRAGRADHDPVARRRCRSPSSTTRSRRSRAST